MQFFDIPFQMLFTMKAWRFSAVLLLSGRELSNKLEACVRYFHKILYASDLIT